MKLSQIALKGIQWSSISQISRQLLQYITTLILANLLKPGDFGLMAMALVITGFIDIFKDLGTSAAVIHLAEINKVLISSIFWLNIFFGILFTLIIFFAAPIIALFFNSTDIIPILKTLSILFFILSFGILPKSLMERDLDFNGLAKIEITSVLAGSILGILLAIMNYGVWSLVFQAIVNNFVFTILILINKRVFPGFEFSIFEIKTVSNYSLNLVGYNIFNYFVRNADYMIIGRYLGENQLGNYYLAYKIMLYPLQSVTTIISRVLFPLYSKLKNDLNRFKEIYLKSTHAIALLTFPMMIGMMAVSEFFVKSFFSNAWDTNLLIQLLIILAPVGLIQSIAATTGSIYMSTGKTNWMFGWGIFSGIITITGFIIGLQWGVIGIAVSYLITTLLLFYPVFFLPFKIIKLNFLKFLKNFWKILLSCIIMWFLVTIASNILLINLSSFYKLLIFIVIGLSSYVITIKIIDKENILYLKKLLSERNAN